MKQKIILALLVTCILILIAISSVLKHGDVSECVMDYGHSEVYTREEMDNAVAVIKKYFREYFAGCKLHSIKYGGDNNSNGYSLPDINSLKSKAKYDKLIVFYVDFDTNGSNGPALEPDRLYTDYAFVLVGSNNKWDVFTCGYA